MNEQRGAWFLLTGLALGLALGVVFAWFISPVQYVDILPSDLSLSAQDAYRALIALSFQSNTNLERARQRLALLKDGGTAQSLASQAQRIVAAGTNSGPEARALAFLASALGPQVAATSSPTSGALLSPTPKQLALLGSATATLDLALAIRTATPPPSATPTLTRTVTLTPQYTFTPRPTQRSSPTLGAPFALKGRTQVCDPSLPQPLLQVDVFNSAGQGVGGMRIVVTWDGGEDDFFTGLMPDSGPGHADFVMTPQVPYAVRVGDGTDLASGLRIPNCTASDGSNYSGGWALRFSQ